MKSLVKWSVLACSMAMLGVGCGGSDTPTTDAAVTPDAFVAEVDCTDGDATAGETAATSACTTCHGADLGGNDTGTGVPGPNLTPTELDGWTDGQLVTAILDGTDDEGVTLCSSMTRFRSLHDEAWACDVVAYLRTIDSVTRDVPACE